MAATATPMTSRAMATESASSRRASRPPLHPLRRRALSANDLRNISLQTMGDSMIKVFARLRPTEEKPICEIVTESDGKKAIVVDKNKFTFSDVLDSYSNQREVFHVVGQPLLNSFLEGYNVCLMAYGHTCSGKTHSISGTYDDPGVIPRFCDRLWEKLSPGGLVVASFYEIYQEKVYDLLSSTRQPLRIRGTEQPYVEGIHNVEIENAEQFREVLSIGWANRATSATIANDRSSRSHAIFMIRYTRKQKVNGEEANLSSCSYFVDLAGSERIPVSGIQRDESVSINVSLGALRRVVMARSGNPTKFVNCRDSTLTRLLQEAFIGNSRTYVLATLAPKKEMCTETMCTLRFSASASKVKLKPELTVDKVSLLQQEIVRLTNLLGEVNLTSQSVNFVDVKAPGFFELFPDSALNRFTPMPTVDEYRFTDGKRQFAVHATNPPEFALSKCEDVYLNGELCFLDRDYKIKHGDRIALGGSRFFVAYGEDSRSEELLNFYRVKNEYVEAVYSTLEEKLRNEAREALQEEVAGETESLRSIIDDLKEQLQEQKTTAAEKERLSEELQTYLLMQQNLQGECMKQKLKLQGKNSGRSSEMAEAEIAVSIANDVLESFGKKAIFSFKLELSEDPEFGLAQAIRVRLINRKQCITADLTLAEFYGLKERLCEAYKTSLVDGDNLGIVERLLYSENWHWNQMASRKSSLFNTAMVNCLRMTANARKSSVAQIRKSLAFRRTTRFTSSIEPVDEKDEVFEFMNLSFSTTLKTRIEEMSSITRESGVTILARNIDNVQKTYEHLCSIEDKIMKDKSAILVAKFDALRAIDALVEGVSGARGMESFEMATYIFDDMMRNGVKLAKSLDSWNHSEQQGSSGKMFLENMEHAVLELYSNLGRLVFWAEENRPNLTLSLEVTGAMEKAMLTELTTISGEVEKRMNRLRDFAGLLFRILIMLGEAYLVILRYFLGRPWDYAVMNRVLWPLYKLIRSVMKVKGGIVPPSMVETLKQIQQNVREEVRDEEVVMASNVHFMEFLAATY